jgi:hypothetical protein
MPTKNKFEFVKFKKSQIIQTNITFKNKLILHKIPPLNSNHFKLLLLKL